jgi:hypothetical protein
VLPGEPVKPDEPIKPRTAIINDGYRLTPEGFLEVIQVSETTYKNLSTEHQYVIIPDKGESQINLLTGRIKIKVDNGRSVPLDPRFQGSGYYLPPANARVLDLRQLFRAEVVTNITFHLPEPDAEKDSL